MPHRRAWTVPERLGRLMALLCVLGAGAAAAAEAVAVGADPKAHALEGVVASPWQGRGPLPKLEGADLTGKVWRLQDLQGRAVLIHFWKSACEACVQGLPALQDLAEQYGPDRLVVLTVQVQEPEDRVLAFARTHHFNLPVLSDPQGHAARHWDVRAFPGTVLVGVDGRARQRLSGAVDWSLPAAQRRVDALFRKKRD